MIVYVTNNKNLWTFEDLFWIGNMYTIFMYTCVRLLHLFSVLELNYIVFDYLWLSWDFMKN